jgi:hypothetical protein
MALQPSSSCCGWVSLRRGPLVSRPLSPVWHALPADWQEPWVLPHAAREQVDGGAAKTEGLKGCARGIDPRHAAPSASGVLPHGFRGLLIKAYFLTWIGHTNGQMTNHAAASVWS